MRKYPECAYNGDFYCNHEWNPAFPWVWVDFSFFHTRLKRYFAVAATTLEYHLCQENEEKAYEELNKTHPYDGPGMIMHPINPKTNTGRITFTDDWREVYDVRKPLEEALLLELNSKAQKVSPTIDVKDYGQVAVGLWVTLNTPHIDENVIREFIKFYRSIGEPIEPGRVWTGEEVDCVPGRIKERYAST